jgi:hypothetical protein
MSEDSFRLIGLPTMLRRIKMASGLSQSNHY